MPQILPMYCPTINSFKRLVTGYWAPVQVKSISQPFPQDYFLTMPFLQANWGVENRTTALRVIPSDSSVRVETRIPGADANPYLSMAAAIGSGFYGIRKGLYVIIVPFEQIYFALSNHSDWKFFFKGRWMFFPPLARPISQISNSYPETCGMPRRK